MRRNCWYFERTSNNSNRWRSNKTDNQRLSSNLVENNTSTPLNDKVNNSTFASAVSGKFDVSNYVCAFCHDKGHAMWHCAKYLSLNLDQHRDYLKINERCLNCLERHSLPDCPSKYKCYTCNESHNSALCPQKQNLLTMNNRSFVDNTLSPPLPRATPHVSVCTNSAADDPKSDAAAVSVIENFNCENI